MAKSKNSNTRNSSGAATIAPRAILIIIFAGLASLLVVFWSTRRVPQVIEVKVPESPVVIAPAAKQKIKPVHAASTETLQNGNSRAVVAELAELRRWNEDRSELTSSYFSALAALPDGRRVLTNNAGYFSPHKPYVRLWDLDTGREVGRFGGSKDGADSSTFGSVSLGPDGRHVLVIAVNGDDEFVASQTTLKLLDLETGKDVLRFEGHVGRVWDAALAPDGRRAISCGEDGTVRIWNVYSGKELHKITGNGRRVLCVAFSPDGRRAVFGGGQQPDPKSQAETEGAKLRLVEVDSGTELGQFDWQASRIRSVAFSPDGRHVATGNLVQSSSQKTVETDQPVGLWDVATGRRIQNLPGPKGTIQSLAFSADGHSLLAAGEWGIWISNLGDRGVTKTLGATGEGARHVVFSAEGNPVTTSKNGSISLWDAKTGAETGRLIGHQGPVLGAAASSNTSRLVTCGDDNTIRVWDMKTGRETRKVEGRYPDVATCLAAAPDGRHFVAACFRVIRLFDMQVGQVVREFRGHDNLVTSLAISHDGRRLVSGSVDGSIRLWDVATGGELRQFKGHGARVMSVAISPDDRFVLSGGGRSLGSGPFDHSIRLWDAKPGRQVRSFGDGSMPIKLLTFTPDGRYIVASRRSFYDSSAKTMRKDVADFLMWDATSGTEYRRFGTGEKDTEAIAITPDGNKLLSAGEDKIIRAWDLAGRAQGKLVGHTAVIKALAILRDGDGVASCGEDNTIRLWSLKTGREIRQIAGREPELIFDLAFTPDGSKFLSGGQQLRLRDSGDGHDIRVFGGHTKNVNAVAVSSDGSRALAGTGDGSVHLWEIGSGREVHHLRGPTLPIKAVAFSADGRIAASGGGNGPYGDLAVRLWDLAAGRELRRLDGPQRNVNAIAFSPDGRYVAAGWGYFYREEGTICLWNVATGQLTQVFDPREPISSVAFSADGRLLATGSGRIEKSPGIRLWDLATAREIQAFWGHTRDVTHLAFSPDSRRLISSGEDRTTRIWNAQSGAELARYEGDRYPDPAAAPLLLSLKDAAAFTRDARRALLGIGTSGTLRVVDLDLHSGTLPDPPHGLAVRPTYNTAGLPKNELAVAERRRASIEANALKGKTNELLKAGRFAEAVVTARRVVELRKISVGEKDTTYATALSNLAVALGDSGDLAAARPMMERALAIETEVSGERSEATAVVLNNLGTLHHSLGNMEEARPLFEKLLELRKAGVGSPHDRALGMINLASVLRDQGDIVRARSLIEQSLAIHEEAHCGCQQYVLTLGNLSALRRQAGDLAGARTFAERALAACAADSGERHPNYAASLINLATVLHSQHDPEAIVLLMRATEIQKSALGELHPDYAASMANLSLIKEAKGEHDEAKVLLDQAQAIRKQVLGEGHPEYSSGLGMQARIAWTSGDLKTAQALYERALEIHAKTLGDRDRAYAEGMCNLALVLWDKGDVQGAQSWAIRSMDKFEALSRRTLPTLGEREQLALLASSQAVFSAALSVFSDQDRDDYRRVLAWKGLTTVRRAFKTKPEDRAILEILNPLRAQLNNVYNARVPADRVDEYARSIRDLSSRCERLEADLAQRAGPWSQTPEPEQIADALPEGVALIEFVRYEHRPPPGPPGTGGGFGPRYVAFVIKAGQSPKRIDIGRVTDLEEDLAAWRFQLQKIDGDPEEAGRRVGNRVWSPLEASLKGSHTVLIAPVGDLCFLPWGALPDREPGSFLLKTYAFGTVVSGRQIVESWDRKDLVPAAGGLLAVGGVDYGRADNPGVVPIQVASRSLPVDRETLTFKPLDATQSEAESVAALFKQGKLGPVELLKGQGATKARLGSFLSGRRYLHLATHGYFAPPELGSALVPANSSTSVRSWEGMSREQASGYHPGLLSGLVWAGASRPPADPVTGVVDVGAGLMTAEEVSGLNLSGCELAVLSACETGLGRTAGGEGVLGLQRAFQQAGARSVLASLWRVDDTATRALMIRFYENLWIKKLPVLEALRQAQLAILDDPNIGDGASPRLWAAWSLGGDPGLALRSPNTGPKKSSKPVQPPPFSPAAAVPLPVAGQINGSTMLASKSFSSWEKGLFSRERDVSKATSAEIKQAIEPKHLLLLLKAFDTEQPVNISLTALRILAHGSEALKRAAFPEILKRMEDRQPLAQRLAATMLVGSFGDIAKPSIPRLIALLKAEDEEVRLAASMSLKDIDKVAAKQAGIK